MSDANLSAAQPDPTPPGIMGFRVQIDSAINSFPWLKPSREVSLAHANLQRAFMWLGEALKASGSQSPYVNSSNPANATIEPQAEHTENTLYPRWTTLPQTQTARVKDFRYYLEQLIQNFRAWKEQSESAGPHYAACVQSSFMALIEAKCWFGWELNRIKKEKEAESSGMIAQSQILQLPL